MFPSDEEVFLELEQISIKFKDILDEINKKFRQEVRRIGEKKNVVPCKYILPKEYVTRLLEYKDFRRVWNRKSIWRYIKGEEKKEGYWIKIETFPNIGGVPVEEGKELEVIVERIPRRTRKRKIK